MLFALPRMGATERRVLDRLEELRRALRYAVAERRRWVGVLRRTLFARAVQGSNTIEGYTVPVDEAAAALAGDEPLDADPEGETWQAILGYRDAMTYVLQRANDPHFTYSEELIRSLHYFMLRHELSKDPGLWRPGEVYVRNDSTGEIVYTGPDAEAVPSLVRELVQWLEGGDLDSSVMICAGMAHLNLVMIHPFRDGNGRMARCLQTLVLAREGIFAPEFSSIEEYLGRNTLDYYTVLAKVGGGRWQPGRDASPWIRFVLTAHYRQARRVQARIKEANRLWDELEIEVRRLHLPERTMDALQYTAVGYRLRNAEYRSMTEVNEGMATRDLAALVRAGLLEARGERRGRFYVAAEPLRVLRSRIRSQRDIDVNEDPFAGVA